MGCFSAFEGEYFYFSEFGWVAFCLERYVSFLDDEAVVLGDQFFCVCVSFVELGFFVFEDDAAVDHVSYDVAAVDFDVDGYPLVSVVCLGF